MNAGRLIAVAVPLALVLGGTLLYFVMAPGQNVQTLTVDELLARLDAAAGVDEVDQIVAGLAAHGRDAVFPILERYEKADDDAPTRLYAAKIFTKLDPTLAVGALGELLKREKDSARRSMIEGQLAIVKQAAEPPRE